MNNESNQTPNAKLIAHCGAQVITRNELAMIPAPPATASHKPIQHGLLVDVIEETLKNRNLKIAKESYAVQTDGMKLFGTMVLEHASQDYAFALGIRTANDKSMSVQMCAGSNVFVCDNMAFSGSTITLARKHTSRINIRFELRGAVERAINQFAQLEGDIDRLKAFSLNGKDVVAKSLILDAAVNEVMPLRLIPTVAKHYFEPPHEEFRERNLWTLHNAFTEAFKELKPNIAMQASMDLGSMFKMGMV